MRPLPTLAVSGILCGSILLANAQDARRGDRPGQDRGVQNREEVGVDLSGAAGAFLESLDEKSRVAAHLPYASPKRTEWNFVPLPTRKGLPVMQMTELQRQAADSLLRAVLSQVGYTKSKRIMELESLLRELEGPGSEDRRNPEKYYYAVYGDPTGQGPWGLSVEGHHLSLNFAMEGGRVVESTPQFMGSNPATILEDHGPRFKKGETALTGEEQRGFELLASLEGDRRAKAVIAQESPKEIASANKVHAEIGPPRGLPAAEMTPEQQELLRNLINAYTVSMIDEVAARRWELIEQSGFGKVHFAWAGGTERGVGHAYTIQGPSFLVEYVNNQADAAGNPANHAHCIWRDTDGDFNLSR